MSEVGADPQGHASVRRVVLLAAFIDIGLGLLGLVGWATGARWMSALAPDAPVMKANAAVLLGMLGAALALEATGRASLHGAARLVVGFALAATTATMLEHASGLDLGIDRLLAADVIAPGAPYPGRMAPATAIAFAAAALALLSLGRSWRGWHPGVFLALGSAVVGALGVLGYLYGAIELTEIGSSTRIALPTALGILVLSAGLIAADPANGPMRLLRDRGLAGQLTRRLVPTTIVVVPLVGWLRLQGQQAQLFDQSVGVAISVFFEVLIIVAVGVWTANGALRIEQTRAEAVHERDRLTEILEQTARTDELTGLKNRLCMKQDLRVIRARIARYREHYGLLVVDVDQFKAVNDELGHVAGDRVLRAIAESLASAVRAEDGTYRYGGEEFVVLMNVTRPGEALLAAERLRGAVDALAIPNLGNPPHKRATVSVGVASIGPDDLAADDDAWFSRADAALYRAKARGRNCCECEFASSDAV